MRDKDDKAKCQIRQDIGSKTGEIIKYSYNLKHTNYTKYLCLCEAI